MEQGYATPWEAEASAELTRKETTVGEWLQPLMIRRPIHMKSEHSFESAVSVYRSAIKVWGERRAISTVVRDDIELLVIAPCRNGAPKPDTIRGRFIQIRVAMARAMADGQIQQNPCDGIKIPKPGKGRLRFLTVSEAKQLLQESKAVHGRNEALTSAEFVHAMTAAGYYTGGRADEIFHLEWTDINRQTERVTIQPKPHLDWDTKNGKGRTIGVNRDLLSILDS